MTAFFTCYPLFNHTDLAWFSLYKKDLPCGKSFDIFKLFRSEQHLLEELAGEDVADAFLENVGGRAALGK